MKALRICILLASVTSMAPALSRLAAQDQPENPKFSLKLNELRPKGYLGKNILITIVMTNISEEIIDCSSFVETAKARPGYASASGAGSFLLLGRPEEGGG